MAVLTNGNVGIGTPAPQAKLHVGPAHQADWQFVLGTSFRVNGGNLGDTVGDDLPLGSFAYYPSGGNQASLGIHARKTSGAGGWGGTAVGLSLDVDNQIGFGGGIWFNNGNVGIGKIDPGTKLDVAGEITCVAVNLTSDRNAKEEFKPVGGREVLAKVAALPITEWQYKTQGDARHIGPMAQDFHAAFAVGRDDKHITTVDADGVALAAIQGLNEKLEEQLRDKDARLEGLEKAVRELQQLVNKITTHDGGAQ